MNKRAYQPPRLTPVELERLIATLRTSDRESDRAVAAEIDAYRAVRRIAAYVRSP